jgi:hypothetical protein
MNEGTGILVENVGADIPAAQRPPALTIKDSIERYKNEREMSPSPALREVINFMINQNIKTEFNNDSYLDALTLTELMFIRSTHDIRILTGSNGDGFLNALKEPFSKALDVIMANGGKVKIIVLGQTTKCLEELQKKYAGTLEVIRGQATGPVKHFTVCDSRMARTEQEHGQLNDNTLATEIKARVCFNDPVQAKSLEDFFDQIWNRLKLFMQKSEPKPSQIPPPAA